jgi:phospholipase/carboxylesterase
LTQEKSNLGFEHIFVRGLEKRTILLLHGTGGDESDLIPIVEMIDPRASFLGVRGKVLENGMPRYFRRFSEGVFDEEDLKFRTLELASFITKASETYKFDLDQLFILGYSNGANIGASLILLQPQLVAGAILFRAMIPFRPKSVPDLRGKNVLISSGRYDPITPQERVEELANLLKSAGAVVTVNWVDSSHSLASEDVRAAKQWLQNEFPKE